MQAVRKRSQSKLWCTNTTVMIRRLHTASIFPLEESMSRKASRSKPYVSPGLDNASFQWKASRSGHCSFPLEGIEVLTVHLSCWSHRNLDYAFSFLWKESGSRVSWHCIFPEEGSEVYSLLTLHISLGRQWYFWHCIFPVEDTDIFDTASFPWKATKFLSLHHSRGRRRSLWRCIFPMKSS